MAVLASSLDHKTQIFVKEAIPGHIEQTVYDRVVDFGIMYLPVPLEGMDHLKVGPVRFGVFARKDLVKANPLSQIPFAVPISTISCRKWPR